MEDNVEVIELIRRFQSKRDPESKNQLLARYYEKGCKWAKGRINKMLYTDLISPSSAEIASMVYQSFEKSIYTIKTDGDNTMSFQNYFYLMIRYQIYSEMKSTLNYRVIPNYQKEVNNLLKEIREITGEEARQIRQATVDHALAEIVDFLEEKNPEYAKVIILRSQGYKTKEICRKLNISEMTLKARNQYIKKLIHGKFDYPSLGF